MAALELLGERQGSERSRDYAYRVLRYNIVTMRLPPGAALSEQELIGQLDMSRTPIREALILLKDEGLADIMPQRGSKVAYISLHGVREGFFMRRVLESVMLRELAGRLSNGQIVRLRENLAAQEAALDAGGRSMDADFFSLDNQLHKLLYEFSGWERMWESVHKVCSHYDRVRFLDTAANQADHRLILEQHRRLVSWLSMGLPAGADPDDFCARHLGRWLEHAEHMLSAYPEYFTD